MNDKSFRRRVPSAALAVERLEDRVTPVSFGTATQANINGAGEDVAVGDLNGDGKPDAVGTSSSGATVFLGDGNGNLSTGASFGLGGSFPRTALLADVTGDGHPDLVAGLDLSATVAIVPGNGDGTFQAPVDAVLGSFGTGKEANSVVVGDFNGDGKLDVVAVTTHAGIAVLLNNGSSSVVGSPVFYPYGYTVTTPTTQAGAVGDFNGDGKPDVAVADSGSNELSIFLNQGNGTFGTPLTIPTGSGSAPASILAADWQGHPLDLNGDGKTDLLVGDSSTGFVAAYLGNGDGTFQAPTTYGDGTSYAGRMVAADFDADGATDVAVVTQSGVSVLPGTGTGAFGTAVSVTSVGNAGVKAADLNGDGLPDLVGVQNTSPGVVEAALNTTPVPTLSSFAVAAPSAATAGQGFSVTVTARDSSNATLTGYRGTVHFTGSDPQSVAGSGLPDNYKFTAADNGVHTFTNVVLKTAGSDTVTAASTTTASATGSATLTVSSGAAASVAVVSGGGQAAAVGTAYAAPLVAVVTDRYGNPVSGVAVTFAGTGVTFPSGASATTGADGRATIQAAAGTTAGAYTVTAASGASTPTSFSLTGLAGPAAAVGVVSGGGQTAAAGAAYAAPLVAVVTDQYGNAVSGVAVTFAGTGVAFPAGPITTTGADGRATIRATAGTAAESTTATATAVGVTSPAAYALTVTAGPVAAVTAVSGGGQSNEAGQPLPAPLVAVVTDQYGNPVAGAAVTFAGTGVTFPGGAVVTTGADGRAAVTPTLGTAPGGYTVTAAVAGASAAATFALTGTHGGSMWIGPASGDGQTAAAGTAFAAPLVVEASDRYFIAVPGVTVTFSGAGVSFPDGTTAVTGDDGKAGVRVIAERAGPVTVTAQAIGITLTFTLTVTAGPASSVAAVSGGGQSAAAGAAYAAPLVVLVTDQYGNPVAGATVTFTDSGVTFPAGGTATTGADGRATIQPTAGTAPGTYAVTAKTSGVTAPVTAALTVTAGPVASVAAVSGGGQSAAAGAAYAAPLVALVTDQYGNPVAGATVTFTGSGVTFPNGSTAVTGADGRATVPVAAGGTAGSYSASAAVAGGSGQAAFALAVTGSPATGNPGTESPALAPVIAVGSDAGGASAVTVYNANGSVKTTLDPFPGFTGGVRTAVGDFNGDGVADVAAGTGPGATAEVKVLDGATGAVLFDVTPFADFTGGVFVAAGDVTGDGKADLVVTPDVSGGPRVEVYRGGDFAEVANFFGIDDPNFRGGARAAVGDLNGDGHADLVVSAGFGGGPRLSVFDGAALAGGGQAHLVPDFFLFESSLRNGAYVAVGDVNGDGFGDLIGGAGPGGGPRVLVASGAALLSSGAAAAIASPVANFFAGDAADRGGVRVAAADLDGDGAADVVTGSGAGDGSHVAAYLGKGLAAGSTAADLSFDDAPGFTGGVFVG